MSDFSPGQRWISDGEAELGLGTVLNCDARSVTILFSASQETRTYNTRQAPLTRVMFGSGDRVLSADGWQMIVDDSKETRGLITYIGEDSEGNLRELPEAKLADTMQALGRIKTAAEAGFSYDQMLEQGNAAGEALVMGGVNGLIDQTRSIERAVATLQLTDVEFEGSDSLDNPGAVFQ